jgi:23S rRNA (uracil1939-C5)-methyltransferase
MGRESNKRRGPERVILRGLEVLRWAHGGDGVAVPGDGPLSGRIVFLEDAVPGDVVDAEVLEQKARWARARILKVARASPERRRAPCPIQARCGGCPWMNGTMATQASSRQKILVGEVRKVLGDAAADLVELAPSGPELGHRQRLRLRYEVRSGRVTLGLHGRRTHSLIDVERCAVADPRLNDALPAVRAALAGRGDGAGRVTLLAGRSASGFGAWVEPERGEAWALGEALVELEFGRFSQALSPVAFAQANAAVTGEILELLHGWALTLMPDTDGGPAPGASPHVVELFAGSGTLTMALWAAGCRVTAYEVDARARAAFERTRVAMGGEASWHELDLTLGVPHPAPPTPIHGVVLDPPRTGAREVMPWVRAARPGRAAYLSCDLATGLRDAAELTSHGYRVERIIGFDMFPHTGHQEILVLLAHADTPAFKSAAGHGMGTS